MAITNATRLADFATGIGTQGAIIKVDNANQRVGIGTTDPTSMFSVGPNDVILMDGIAGVVTATKFVGDGSDLTGVSGFATALSNTQGTLLNHVFKTPESFTVGAGTSVTIESDGSSGNIAFARLGIISVGAGATLHVALGCTMKMNILNVFP